MKYLRMLLLFGILLIIIVFFLTKGQAEERTEPEMPLTPESVQGQYEGYFPCADCLGIEYKLLLSRDGTYSESLFYTGRSKQPVLSRGTFAIDGDIVVLDKSEAGLKFFSPHPRGLLLLDIQGEPIDGGLSQRSILTRKIQFNDTMPKTATLVFMQQKLAQGIGFYGVGNEPSWAVDIDFDKGMRFKSLTELSEFNTPPGREDKAQDADVTRFFSQTEAGTLIVTVMREQCTDPMSGELFP